MNKRKLRRVLRESIRSVLLESATKKPWFIDEFINDFGVYFDNSVAQKAGMDKFKVQFMGSQLYGYRFTKIRVIYLQEAGTWADDLEPAPRDAGELEAAINKLPEDAIPELNESRARREHYQAELAKLQVTQQRGELVPVDEVKKEAFNIGRAVREALANLADRLSHQLAGEVDPVVIHKLLSDEHRAALLELAGGEEG